MRFVFAVAADREARCVRERGEELEVVLRRRLLHLGAVLLHERAPRGRRLRTEPELHGREARREVRKPDVVEVSLRELRLRHSARRPPHGADAQAFAACTRRAEANDADAHARAGAATAAPSASLRSPDARTENWRSRSNPSRSA